MKWFKFYGQDFLTDSKMKALTVEMRQCWIVLLCMANGEDKNGKIKYVNEYEVMRLAGIEEDGQTWHETIGFLEMFEQMEMITIDNVIINLYDITLINYQKRQGDAKTAYQRVKEYRERKKHDDNASSLSNRNKTFQNVIKNEANDNNDNENDNTRIDKNRIDKNIKKESSRDYLKNFPIEDFSDIDATEKQIRLEGEKAYNWCLAKGKVQKDYKAFLRNWVLKVFKKKTIQEVKPIVEYDPAGIEKINEIKSQFSIKGIN